MTCTDPKLQNDADTPSTRLHSTAPLTSPSPS